MARRKRKGDASQAVSLFPFLSILACVIGTLTLMITALALGQMDTDDLAGAEQLAQAEKDRAENEAAARQLKEQINAALASAGNDQKQQVNLENRLAEVRRQVQETIQENQAERPPPKIPAVDEEAHAARLKQIEAEIAQAKAEAEKLAAEIKARGAPPEQAEVQIRPGGSGVDFEPSFVECAAAGLILYDENDQPTRVRRADLATDANFLSLLKHVADGKKRTVIFLVREDALPVYYAAQRIAQANYARNGKLPIIGQGKVDLTLFREGSRGASQ